MQSAMPDGMKLPAPQVEVMNRKFVEDLQTTFDIALGWKQRANYIGLQVELWIVIFALYEFKPVLVDFPLFIEHSGLPSGVALAFNYCGALAAIFLFWKLVQMFRIRVARLVLKILREEQGRFNAWILVKHLFNDDFR